MTARNHVREEWNERPPGKANFDLASFVEPRATGVADYLGAFAVTAGLGIEKALAAFEAKKDDYNAIVLRALACR